jgi:capsular exopolysaccharide synthesis family protein
VDADLRRPRMHRVIGVKNREGLSSLLTGNASFEEAVHETEIPGLSILPSGPPPPNPSELLDSEAFNLLVGKLESSSFAHVIFDSPPVLSVSDPQILGGRASVVVLVVRAGSTSRESARQSVESLRKVRARLVGVVLNDISRSDSRYQYRYYDTGRSKRDSEPNGQPVEKGLVPSLRAKVRLTKER